MNELTKEELQIILLDLNDSYNRTKAWGLTTPKSMTDLIKKVDMMIENYCEKKLRNKNK